MEIILFRHGKFHVKNNNYFGAHLSEEGIKKGTNILESGIIKKPDLIFSSHFIRAVESARLIADYFKINFTIKECLGEWKLQELNLLFEEYEKEENAAIKNLNFPVRGGESLNMAGSRVHKCVIEIIKSNPKAKRIIIVSHGNVLYWLFKKLLNQKPDFDASKEMIDFFGYGIIDYNKGKLEVKTNIISKI